MQRESESQEPLIWPRPTYHVHVWLNFLTHWWVKKNCVCVCVYQSSSSILRTFFWYRRTILAKKQRSQAQHRAHPPRGRTGQPWDSGDWPGALESPSHFCWFVNLCEATPGGGENSPIVILTASWPDWKPNSAWFLLPCTTSCGSISAALNLHHL